MLGEPGRFRAVQQIDCRLDLLPSAKPLKHRAPVHFHAGTAEIEAEVRLLDGTAAMQPGRARLRAPGAARAALLLPGDRFIIRMFSPVVTIGGGVVVDIGRRRYRKADDVKARLDMLGGARRGGAHRAAGARIRIRHGDRRPGGAHRPARTRDRGRRRQCAADRDRAAAALVRGSRLVAVGARTHW